MPEDTIASTVAFTVCSVSGMPEFHEFHPIGGVSRCGAPESVGAAHQAMLAPAKLSAATIDHTRTPTRRGSPTRMCVRCQRAARPLGPGLSAALQQVVAYAAAQDCTHCRRYARAASRP